jgi:hypothetical protein
LRQASANNEGGDSHPCCANHHHLPAPVSIDDEECYYSGCKIFGAIAGREEPSKSRTEAEGIFKHGAKKKLSN